MRSPLIPKVFNVSLHHNPSRPEYLLIDRTAWRTSRISHFDAEDFRLAGLHRSDEPTLGGYIEEPNRDFPERPPGARWMYVIDLQYETRYVSLEDCSSRMFCLDNLPWWLFESAAAVPLGLYTIEHEKQLFIAPVSVVYLLSFEFSQVPGMVLLAHCESYASKLCHLPRFPGVEVFPVRMYLRLILITHFHNEHVQLFRSVNNVQGPMSMEVFRWLLYCIVKLSRSRVEVCFRKDDELDDPPDHTYIVNKWDESYAALYAMPQNWVDGLPIVLERDISTTENLHAAIGKAIQLSTASGRTPVTESARQ